jgi:hypothetical protein
MRLGVCCFLLSAAAAFPAGAWAQFQTPTAEELKMTADPKAPGAAAVFLYREEVGDQATQTRTLYERIKVLTEKGKELATVGIPYELGWEQIADVQARTIHSDGTVIPMTEKPSDLVDIKTGTYQRNKMVFTVPNVELGSILEYRVTFKFFGILYEPTWMIQEPYFIHKAHFSFKSFNPQTKLSYEAWLANTAKVITDKKGLYTVDVVDVPPIPDEDWMPPLNTIKWRVDFYYSSVDSSAEFWREAGKRWNSVVTEFITPTGDLRKVAAGIAPPGDTETRRAQKLYDAVMNLENTGFTRRKSEAERKKDKIRDINRAEDVWWARSGTSDEIALLYVALARASGLNVEPMIVVDRSRAVFDVSVLSARQLDDYIAVAKLDGKEVFLDPGQKMCPFGLLHWAHTNTSGFRMNGKEAGIARTPAFSYQGNGVERVAELTIDSSGNVTGSIRFILKGQDALYWRQIALENDQDEVKKRFNESMKEYLPEGVEADFDHFVTLEDYSVDLMATVKVSGSLGTTTGRRMFLPGVFFEARAKHPFVTQDKRVTPVDLHYARMEDDDVTYHFPDGYALDAKPQDRENSWEGHANFKMVFAAGTDSVNSLRTLAYNYALLDPKDYPGLHDFYQNVATADQQQLVLIRSQVAKGN